jgi:hypothetical protein
MPDSYVAGLPGIHLERLTTGNYTAVPKEVFKTRATFAAMLSNAPRLIDGGLSRDTISSTNPGQWTVLGAGSLLGRVTATGRYASSVIGLTTVNYVSGGTSLTVSLATAAELVRRIGTSGTFKLTGPPSANGTIATTVVTYSAVNLATGVVTVSNIGVNYLLGSLVQPSDGSETIKTFVPDKYGMKVTEDAGGVTNLIVPFPQLPQSGVVIASALLGYPTDVVNLQTLQAYIKAALRVSAGPFSFDDDGL